MNKLLIAAAIVICSVWIPCVFSANDLNVMDDIGFNKTFGYYSSANETINMQTGNVILEIPISPVYPGPEGSGLDLQLKLIYNSQCWKYKQQDTSGLTYTPPEEDPHLLYAEVDLNKMLYSPVGFGWRLHMGRLLRMRQDFGGGCCPTQYYFEDPSGALHDFGCYYNEDQNYCEDTTYWSQDASDYVLYVEQQWNADDDICEIERIRMFDGTGRVYHFTVIPLPVPHFPTGCDGGDLYINPEENVDVVFYVKEITSLTCNESIEITYTQSGMYSNHLIHQIKQDVIGSAQREITFNYDYNGPVPCLDSISEPGFDWTTNVYNFDYQFPAHLYEPWGQACCMKVNGGDPDCTGGIYLFDQLQLTEIALPCGYNYSFNYTSFGSNNGEIKNYTNPLGAVTEYFFRNLTTISTGENTSTGAHFRHYNPSRFIYKKVLNANSRSYIWKYNFSTDKGVPYLNGDIFAGYYDDAGNTIENWSEFGYGGSLPMSWVQDPDKNDTVYLWKDERFWCQFGNMNKKGWWEEYDCPVEYNAYNGRLKKIMYFQNPDPNSVDNSVSPGNLRKEEVFNDEYNIGLGNNVTPVPYQGSCGHFEYDCHGGDFDNTKVFQKNIRQYAKEIRLYDQNSYPDSVKTLTTYSYDEYGNIREIIIARDGLNREKIVRTYSSRVIDLANGKYKVDFLDHEYVYEEVENNVFQLIKREGFSPNGIFRVEHLKEYWGDEENHYYQTDYLYDSFGQLWKKTIDGKTTIYEYSHGALKSETIGNIAFINNVVDHNTGLVKDSYDTAGHATHYCYDGLNRIIEEYYDGAGRHNLSIDYSGRFITYWRGSNDYKSVQLDNLGNIEIQYSWIPVEQSGYTWQTVRASVYNWRNQEIQAIYPGNTNSKIYNDYDCLGRLTSINDPDSTDTTITFSIDTDLSSASKITKKVIDDEGIERNYIYDLRDNLRVVSTGDPAGYATYEYDLKGNLTYVNRGLSSQRKFEYDWLNRMKHSEDPETGNTGFFYYPDGKLKEKITGEGKIEYTYDDSNRIDQVNYINNESPELIRDFNYDEAFVSFSGSGDPVIINNGDGRLTSIFDWQTSVGGSLLARSYDNFGAIESETILVTTSDAGFQTEVYTTAYSYNLWGNLSEITCPVSGVSIQYVNDGGPFTTGLKISDNTHPDGIRRIAEDICYNPAGGFKQLLYDNQIITGLWPDQRNRISCAGAYIDGTVIFGNTYLFDKLDRITQVDELTVPSSTIYHYFDDGSLDWSTSTGDFSLCDYSYDTLGNMTNRVVLDPSGTPIPGLQIDNYCYNSQNQCTTPHFGYDYNGNVDFNPLNGQAYEFTRENRLTEVSSLGLNVKFIYDGEGKRRLKLDSRSAELYFYDLSGNNLLEKLTMDRAGSGQPKIVKDECFVNLGKYNVAQFNYFEPVISIELLNSSSDTCKAVYYPGDIMTGYINYEFEGPTQDAWLFVILEIEGTDYFYPSWGVSYDAEQITLEKGGGQITFLEPLPLPRSLPNMEGMYFKAFLATSYIEGVASQFGNIAVAEFSFKNPPANLYVRPGPVNGDGSLDNPFNSIQTAVNSANPGSDERVTIKLFPGTYKLTGTDETITINQPGIDIIGSGQDRTFITGLSELNSIVLTDYADSVIQGLTSEINLACGSASPFIRNVRLLNNNALAGIYAVNSTPIVVNCLITNYYAGVYLENSSCYIKNCTIDTCTGSSDYGAIVSKYISEEVYLLIEDSIITNSEIGINITGDVEVTIKHSDIWGNTLDFSGMASQIGQEGNISVEPIYVQGRCYDYYLSSISAGQSESSPCIDAGPASLNLEWLVGGTTRTDGLFDQCQTDMGYHGTRFNKIIGINNLNNDHFGMDDPRAGLDPRTESIDSESITVPDPRQILSTGLKDVMIIKEFSDGTFRYQALFQEDCNLNEQSNSNSPTNIIDASLGDLNGDGIKDLAVLEPNGPSFFVNDTTGAMIYDDSMTESGSKAIETMDFNNDGFMDVLIATSQGVSVKIADDFLDYSEYQILSSGDTQDIVLFDFDGDDDADLVTVNALNEVRFFENNENNGFIEVGTPVNVHGSGQLKILDVDNDGQMDVVVEISPGVEETVYVGSTFGLQNPLPTGKRPIRFVLFDHLGTAKLLTNNIGRVVWPHFDAKPNETLPFGKDLSFDPGNPNPMEASYKLTFTNKEIDHALDLHYFGARYYHAQVPRFISPDPVSGNPANPLSWNRYLYCRNDPLNKYDPDGRVVINLEDHTIYYKPESGDDTNKAIPIYPGEIYTGKQDGIADPINHPGEIYKSSGKPWSPGCLLIVKNGEVITIPGSAVDAIFQIKDGGWKDGNDKNKKELGKDWNNLYAKADDPLSALVRDLQKQAKKSLEKAAEKLFETYYDNKIDVAK
ncbi:hypothetical protein EH221_04515 [bacterium]|nr:MAG: hypothetical protein EH221_04515 [bacterium]